MVRVVEKPACPNITERKRVKGQAMHLYQIPAFYDNEFVHPLKKVSYVFLIFSSIGNLIYLFLMIFLVLKFS